MYVLRCTSINSILRLNPARGNWRSARSRQSFYFPNKHEARISLFNRFLFNTLFIFLLFKSASHKSNTNLCTKNKNFNHGIHQVHHEIVRTQHSPNRTPTLERTITAKYTINEGAHSRNKAKHNLRSFDGERQHQIFTF